MGTQDPATPLASRGRRNFCKAKVPRKEVRCFCSSRCGGTESSPRFMSLLVHSQPFRHPLLNLRIPPRPVTRSSVRCDCR